MVHPEPNDKVVKKYQCNKKPTFGNTNGPTSSKNKEIVEKCSEDHVAYHVTKRPLISDPEVKTLKKNRNNPNQKVKRARRVGKTKEEYEGVSNQKDVNSSYYCDWSITDMDLYGYISLESETKDPYKT